MSPKEIVPGVLSWADDLDSATIAQAARTASLPFVIRPIAIQADGHYGMGSTIGSVVPTVGAIIPSCAGVDLGCGVAYVQTNLTASDLPDTLDPYLYQAIRDIPAGIGQGHAEGTSAAERWFNAHPATWKETAGKRYDDLMKRAYTQFGSLGSGNHFYEVTLDEEGRVGLMLHSGSRGIGNVLAQIHIDKAKGLCKERFISLPDPDLAYLVEGEPEFKAYIADMLWAQDYALGNREAMLDAALRGFLRFVGKEGAGEMSRLSCHHNYTAQERHHGRQMWITRKGAINAEAGRMGIVPGSMGTGSYIVRGLGSAASYNSSSHGAGRKMGRGQATRELDVEEFKGQMAAQGIAWQDKDAARLLDEAPGAYKDIRAVMAAQADLTEVVHTLHQVFNMKGVEGGRRRKGGGRH